MNNKLVLIILLMVTLVCNAQEVKESFIRDLKKRAKKVSVNNKYSHGKWKPVLKKVKNRKIVLLGELNHGSKEIFVSRNDLIKSLHKKLNFDVILFESGIGEIAQVELEKEKLTSQQMTYGFFGGWRTEEFKDLMQYAKENKLSVAGFDVQRTGGSFLKILKQEAQKHGIDFTLFQDIEKRFGEQKRKLTSRKAVYNSVKETTEKLMNDYKELWKLFDEKTTQNEESLLLVKRTLFNRIEYLRYFLDFVKNKNWSKRWKERDSLMASNIEWLLKNIYQDKKVIIVAHNFHIAKFNEKEEVMGEFLFRKYTSDIYSIGVFAGSGSYLGNSGKESSMLPISKDGLDIKKVISFLEGRVHFLDIPKKPNRKNKWLFEKVIINDTFIDLYNSNEMNLSKHFDGLLLIDKISPPVKNN